MERLEVAHSEHERSFEQVLRVLEARGFAPEVVSRPSVTHVEAADLVITVGGDGTFLRSALRNTDTPMVGINSSPTFSVGHYCGLTADSLPSFLDELARGAEEINWLPRIHAVIGETPLPYLALNDVLFCQVCPAASSRYILSLGEEAERHVSSGVWVATPSGSSSAILSAGGVLQDRDQPGLQFAVREAYQGVGDSLTLLGGVAEDELLLTPTSPDLKVFLDGHHLSYDVPLAVPLRLRRQERSLPVYRYGQR
jgi:NAD+ kinase